MVGNSNTRSLNRGPARRAWRPQLALIACHWIIVRLRVAIAVALAGSIFVVGSATASPESPEFPRPELIQTAVGFWTRVYSEIDTLTGFIHDDRNLDIVYEVFPLPADAGLKHQQKLINGRIRFYQAVLRRLASKPRAQWNAEERRVRARWPKSTTSDELVSAASRIRFQRGQSDRFREGLRRERTHDGRIKSIMRDMGIPETLAALPHVESSYNPKVRSHAGAAGLWQIMPATGKRFLRIDNAVDERLEPIKATRAAAQLLKHNYSILQDWSLAVTAYNHGLSGVRRAVRKTGSPDIAAIVSSYNGRSFGFASRNFYAAFLAAADLSQATGLSANVDADQASLPIRLRRFLPSASIATALGTTNTILKQLNPKLSTKVWNGEKLIPAEYDLIVPLQHSAQDIADTIRNLEHEHGFDHQRPDKYYRIETGDNLSELADRYGTSVGELIALNKLGSRHRITAGRILRLPRSISTTPLSETDGELLIAGGGISAPQAEFVLATAAYVDNSHRAASESPGHDPTKRTDNSQHDTEYLVHDIGAVAAVQPELAADPADYLVADDGSIEVQIGETLGHYALWLGVNASELRRVNGLRSKQQVVIGKRVKLAFSSVRPEVFEQRRKSFHVDVQNSFFSDHVIIDVQNHPLANGDNLWELAHAKYLIPVWLIRQYNPDLDFDSVLSIKDSLRVPIVTAKRKQS